MSALLVECLSEDFAPSAFTDDYQAQLRQLIDAKLAAGGSVDTAATFGQVADGPGGEVFDLMEALRRSVDETTKKKTPKRTPARKRMQARKSAAGARTQTQKAG